MKGWRLKVMRSASAIVAAAVVLGPAIQATAQENPEGPTSLFLSYECKPEKRPAFRAWLEGPGGAQFEKWKKAGTVKDYLILFSSYVNPGMWDAMIRLDFDHYVDTQKWRVVERTMPAGLSAEALAACSPVSSYLADLGWSKTGPNRDLAKTIYKMIPYHWASAGGGQTGVADPRSRYKTFFEAGKKLELESWVDEGAVSWFGVYINQLPAGKPWDVLFMLEYRDVVGLARRDVAKQIMRKQRLMDNPGWKFAWEAAPESRDMMEIVLADPVLPR
jgi:hypothetical protein